MFLFIIRHLAVQSVSENMQGGILAVLPKLPTCTVLPSLILGSKRATDAFR
ncbi:MAG: hypothetical protein HYX66_06595 [Ignavibacteria bacterium]|nr:hypothetical protein [Ignavibacteria bacterium]